MIGIGYLISHPNSLGWGRRCMLTSFFLSFLHSLPLLHIIYQNQVIESAKNDKDSIGGVVTCVCRGVPPGLGEPCFDKLEAKLAHAMLSIPATKGFEIGSGFEGTKMRGSAHNEAFVLKGDGKLGTATNYSGGIQVSSTRLNYSNTRTVFNHNK